MFLSADAVVQDDTGGQLHLADKFLNTLTPSGLAPHRLELKIGAIVMLNRNLNVKRRLCNGARLQVIAFSRRNAIHCKFINGIRKGKSVIIPRIDLKSNKGKGTVSLSIATHSHFYRHVICVKTATIPAKISVCNDD